MNRIINGVTGKRELVLFLSLLLLIRAPAGVDALSTYSGFDLELYFRLPYENPGLWFLLPNIAAEKGVATSEYAPLVQTLEVRVSADRNILSFYAISEVVGRTILWPSCSNCDFKASGRKYGVVTLFWSCPLRLLFMTLPIISASVC